MRMVSMDRVLGAQTTPAPSLGRLWGERHATTPATIFVVDDEPAVRKSLTRLVTSAGYAMEAFASAADFLARKPFGGPCCVVVDVIMLGLTGLDLQQALARSGRRMPIILMSGHDIEMRETAMKRGAVDFLSKPFDVESLLEAIERALMTDVKKLGEEGRTADVRERVKRWTPREAEVSA